MTKYSRIAGICIVFLSSALQAKSADHTFATQLEEVRTGHFNGTEYLTIQISGQVGPVNCRGNILKVDIASFNPDSKQQDIESVALSAMLNDDSVLITVPLGYSDCLDGKPTVSDMYLLSNQ